MPEHQETKHYSGDSSPWKWIAVGLVSVIGAVLLVGVVVAYLGDEPDPAETAAEQAAAAPTHTRTARSEPAQPTQSDIAVCNDYAATVRTSPTDVFKDGLLGSAIGAGVGAAGGAIADGGKGAGKGAGIGAVVGATAGTLYGLNKSNEDSERAAAAYRTCMARRGF